MSWEEGSAKSEHGAASVSRLSVAANGGAGGGAFARGTIAKKGDSQSVLSLLQARELGVAPSLGARRRSTESQSLGDRRRTSVMSPQKFSRCVRGSAALVSRLELEAVHEWHDGCVNTISFTPSGTALISGSDDRHIVVGDWQTVRMLRKSDARTNSIPVFIRIARACARKEATEQVRARRQANEREVY
jgi:hypothetical protein